MILFLFRWIDLVAFFFLSSSFRIDCAFDRIDKNDRKKSTISRFGCCGSCFCYLLHFIRFDNFNICPDDCATSKEIHLIKKTVERRRQRDFGEQLNLLEWKLSHEWNDISFTVNKLSEKGRSKRQKRQTNVWRKWDGKTMTNYIEDTKRQQLFVILNEEPKTEAEENERKTKESTDTDKRTKRTKLKTIKRWRCRRRSGDSFIN